MSRTPVGRASPEMAARMRPQLSGPGANNNNNRNGIRSFGDRDWSGGRATSNRYWNGLGRGYRPPQFGFGRNHGFGQGGHPRYEVYNHGYSAYYRNSAHHLPSYSYAYPYFAPTFGFGLGYGLGYGSYGSAYMGGYPAVYPQMAMVYPSYGTGYYGDPGYVDTGSGYYADAGTAYVQSPGYAADPGYVAPYPGSGTTVVDPQAYPAPSAGTGSVYVDGQYAPPNVRSPRPTIGMPPTAPPATAPPAPQQPDAQSAAPVKEPDQRVLAAVGQGNEHFGAGRYSDARRSYGEAMAIDDTDGVAKLLYGLSSFAEGDFSAASVATQKALDATPDLIWYPFNVKALYRNDTKFQEHVAALARKVDAEPGNTEAQFLLGYMWYASGDAVNAKTVFGALAANNPSDELFMALRDASTQALESLSKQPQQPAPSQPTP